MDPKSLEEGEPIKEEKEMSIECGDTLITDKFDPLALKDGSELIITCIQSCKDSKD